ncbi:hypothetical protein [Aquisalimonas sp.]|uniref:hypothetical protein n=1 Tax=Aquisalimonas sp. TaxID=1872621 RepID=UPI0025B96895|nr:hypothetical protein [Aquisalimonas sp.]
MAAAPGGGPPGPPAFVADIVPQQARENSPVLGALAAGGGGSEEDCDCEAVEQADKGYDLVGGGGPDLSGLAAMLESIVAALNELVGHLSSLAPGAPEA